MVPGADIRLTSKERIILHLRDHQAHASDVYLPEAVTQRGICRSTGIRMSHVPRTLKSLIREGLVQEGVGRVRSSPRRLKVYSLTASGGRAAEELIERLTLREVPFEGESVRISELYARSGIRGFWEFLSGWLLATGSETASPESAGGTFLDRSEELRLIRRFIREREPRAMIIYGSRGVGKSALMRQAVSGRGPRMLWVDISQNTTLDAFIEQISRPLQTQLPPRPGAICRALGERVDLLVIDGYTEVDDDLVDLLARMMGALREHGLKLLVAADVGTPSYSRFYHRGDVESGRIIERTIGGLDPESAKRLLDPIAQDAFDHINKFARGNPLILTLIRARDAEALHRMTKFTREEVRHIIHLYEHACAGHGTR